MRQGLVGALVAGLALVMIPTIDAEAKRVGGARSSGVQRQTPTQPVQKAPVQPDASPNAAPGAAVPGAAAAATAAKAAPAAAAQAAKRSWMGPLMGLAAGLGLAALFSHLGMGETFSSIMMILLLATVGFFLFRFIMGRFAAGRGSKLSPAMAGAGAVGGLGAATKTEPGLFNASSTARSSVEPATADGVRIGSALTPPIAVAGLNDAGTEVTTAASSSRLLPADFDSQAFERAAKMIFIRLQAANDERNLDDLRAFTTPEMFAELRTDILDRGQANQSTEVVSVNPTIVDFEDEGEQQVVSVRYVGVIREEAEAAAASFDEVWHLVKKPDSPAWRIAGIQQAN